jgi:pilus assembly protein CpaE
MTKPQVLLVAHEDKLKTAVAGILKDLAVVVTSASPPSQVVAEYVELRPVLVVVSTSPENRDGLAMVSDLAAAGALVIALGPSKDPDLILAAMRAGAREFLVNTDLEGLRTAFADFAKAAEARGVGGTVVTMFPTRGGVGCTSIVTNLAHAIQNCGQRVCLVDLDLHLGDVLAFLDLPGTYSIADVIANINRLDKDLLDASIARHASGVRVLTQSGKVEEADHVHPPEVGRLLGFLRQFYDFVLVDGVRGFDEMSLAALDASQKIMVILTQDVPAVRNTKRSLDLFRRMGYSDSKLSLVLNRYQKSPDITPQVVEETTGLPVRHTLSNDYAAAISAINRGLPLQTVAPRSNLTKDIEQMVEFLVEKTRMRAKNGFWRNLLSRRSDGPT